MKKIKNYLVCSLCEISANTYGDTHKFQEYKNAYHISRQSFKKNLINLDEIILFDGKVNHIQDVFKDHFFKIYDLWKHEKCNILYSGPDTFCINKTEIFGKFDKFMMFNYTDPSSAFGFEHFFNADVRYYPNSMSQKIWDVGIEIAKNWDYNEWNTEQIILNKMLWSQDISFDEAYNPTLAWQAVNVRGNNNNINKHDSNIIHYHATRNINAAVEDMKKLFQGQE